MDVSTKTQARTCAVHGDYVANGVEVVGRMVWLNCPECTRIDHERDKQERASKDALERQRQVELRLNQAGIPARFRSKDFASFHVDSDEKEKARAIAMEFANNFAGHAKDGAVMVFSGKPGTGKSHLAIAIASAIMPECTAMYISAIDAIRMVRDTWRRNAERTETQVLRLLASVDLLILDEIGVQYGTESEQVTLFDIIDKRYRDQMPMILLTNLTASEMKTFLGDRSYDRLREGGKWVKFDWESQRGSVTV
jgi:DNA replication protein DnaC